MAAILCSLRLTDRQTNWLTGHYAQIETWMKTSVYHSLSKSVHKYSSTEQTKQDETTIQTFLIFPVPPPYKLGEGQKLKNMKNKDDVTLRMIMLKVNEMYHNNRRNKCVQSRYSIASLLPTARIPIPVSHQQPQYDTQSSHFNPWNRPSTRRCRKIHSYSTRARWQESQYCLSLHHPVHREASTVTSVIIRIYE